MIQMSSFVGLLMCALISGCAVRGGHSSATPATLSFAKSATSSEFVGSFRTLDSAPIPSTPLVIELSPGRHTVGYWCPDHIVMDGPPTVIATFEPGKSYVLHCQGNEDGRVEAR